MLIQAAVDAGCVGALGVLMATGDTVMSSVCNGINHGLRGDGSDLLGFVSFIFPLYSPCLDYFRTKTGTARLFG